MHPFASSRGQLIATVPTPWDRSGDIHLEGLRHLVSSLGNSVVDGVAIGTTLGRGSRRNDDQWEPLIATWRGGLGVGKLLIASVVAPVEIRRPDEIFAAAEAQASTASKLGADILHLLPPAALRGRPDRDRLILEYHAILAEVGLPTLLSYRRESVGGIVYGPEVVAQLLARPEVLGIEVATIDGIVTFQQVEALVREFAPDKRVVSGEERFLGYSLMCGADAAMVGIAAAYPNLVRELLENFFAGKAADFLKSSATIDALARPIFRPPIEGSNLRLLEALGIK